MFKNILFVTIVGVVIKILTDLEFIFKTVQEQINYKNCKYLDVDIRGPEDLQFYKDNIIITGSANFGDLFYKGIPKLNQNSFYAIFDSDKKNYTTKKLSLIGFPADVSIYIHGFDILRSKEGDFIYFVNHAYNHGGERIEILKIQDNFDLTYVNSIIMDKSLMGGLNDVIVLNQTRFVVTRYIPEADHENGRGFNSIFHNLKTILSQFLRMKRTYLLDCQFSLSSKQNIVPNCKQVAGSETVMANGITWDHKDRVWFADSVLKKVVQFRITNHELIHEKDIQFSYGLDNIEYDNRTDSLQMAFLGKLYEFLLLENFNSKGSFERNTHYDVWGGFGRYYLKNDSLEILQFSQNLTKGTSGGLVSGQNIFLGSWCDVSVKVCSKN